MVKNFHRHFVKAPIICGREPTATEEEKMLSAQRSTELSEKVNQVISFVRGAMRNSKQLDIHILVHLTFTHFVFT